MKRMYWMITSVLLLASLNSLGASETFRGFDIKNKDQKYQLVLGDENELLEEREFKLFRTQNGKPIPVSKGAVVYTHEDSKKDIAAFYSSEDVSIQFGKPLKSLKDSKQLVVMKIKNDNKTGKTLVFEREQYE